MIDLDKLCSKRIEELEKPFSDGEYSYACDGYILIRVPRRDDIIDPVPECLKLHKVDIGKRPVQTLEIPKFDPPKMIECRVCRGRKATRVCPECKGEDLYIENDFHEYEVDCKTCNGHGVIPKTGGEPCGNCDGVGAVENDGRYDSVMVGELEIAKRLLNKAKDLPGIRMAATSPGNYLRIFFDGGDGAIMALVRS